MHVLLFLMHASLAGCTVSGAGTLRSIRFADALAVTAGLAVTAAKTVSGIPLLDKIADNTADHHNEQYGYEKCTHIAFSLFRSRFSDKQEDQDSHTEEGYCKPQRIYGDCRNKE